MKTLKKAAVVLIFALSALPGLAQGIPTDPDGDGLPNGIDLCPLAYGSGSDGCPSGNYATSRQPGVLDNGGGGSIILFEAIFIGDQNAPSRPAGGSGDGGGGDIIVWDIVDS